MNTMTLFNGKNTRASLLRYEALARYRNYSEAQKTHAYVEWVEDSVVVDIASLDSFPTGNWAAFVKVLIRKYPESK